MKFKLLICFFSMLLSCSVYSQDTLKLKFTDVVNVYNNHVGNEWRFGTFIGDTQLNVGDGINIFYTSLDEIFVLNAVLQEGKEKYNDTNMKEFEFSLRNLYTNYKDGFYIEIDLRENHGRYAGNTALWKFYYELIF